MVLKESNGMPLSRSPIVEFYRLIEEARPPLRADRSAMGTLPLRAARYCDALSSASAFGWWVFPPIDLQLRWDGADTFWLPPGSEEWLVLLPGAQFPGMMSRFDEVAPKEIRGCAPPLLTTLPEPGTLQVWTGMMVRTAPNWSVLVRSPANLALPGGVVFFEGIVETDRLLWPVFINLRFTRSHSPILLRADFPIAQLQPLPRVAYDDATLRAIAFKPNLASLTLDDWAEYRRCVVAPNDDNNRPFGSYAIGARKRRQTGAMHLSDPLVPRPVIPCHHHHNR